MFEMADSLFGSAGSVLSSLVDRSVRPSKAQGSETSESIKIEDGLVTTLAELPSIGVSFVVRFERDDIMRIVDLMVGGTGEVNEAGAMHMSIVSETVSQISSAIAGKLAEELGVSADGARAEMLSDATSLPPPPFDTYSSIFDIENLSETTVIIDINGVSAAKIAERLVLGDTPAAPAAAPAPSPGVAPSAAAARATARQAAAQAIEFTPMTPTAIKSGHSGANLDLVHDIPLQISAVLGQTTLSLRDVVALAPGSVFELDKQSSEPIDLYVNNILIARGEVVVVDDKFAVKISELNPVQEKT